MPPTPARPVLGSHVLARRHIADGVRLVVLHDTDRLTHHRVSERTWAVLAAMDGSRDASGLVAHAASQGFTVTSEEVVALIDELSESGLVALREGAPSLLLAGPTLSGPAPADPAPADPARPTRQLGGFLLSCDGRGSCCRFYPSVAFSPLDAARARTHRPEVLDGGMDESRVFLPMAGHARSMLAVTLVAGCCAYLDRDLGCGVHRASRSDQKPLGCRTYPARFIDDGEAIRVSPWLECACVFRSGIGAADKGEPLLDPAITSRAALDPAFFVETLPAEVLVASTLRATRREVARWSDAMLDEPLAGDPLAALLSLSLALEKHGLDVDASRAALTAPSQPVAVDFEAALTAFQPHIERFASETWRADGDLVRTTAAALQNATHLAQSLPGELLQGPGKHRDAERFYLRGVLFGHQLVQPKALRPMSLLAHDRAFRLLLARSLSVVASLAELGDPAFEWPIALVDATMRGYGLSIYVRDLGI